MRGLNVVVLDETDGSIVLTENFDTHISSNSAHDLVRLIESLPPGKIVAIAVSDEATGRLSNSAKRAIEILGSAQVRSLGYRGSWAFIGKKGTVPGTAIESINNSQAPVKISIILNLLKGRIGLLISAKSAGYLVGNYAHISVNGASACTV